jgi:hypothetical protein
MAQSPEQRKQYQVVKAFKALNTKADRTAIADEEFAWIENIQPIGFGNLKVVAASNVVVSGSNTAVTWANTTSTLSSFNANNNDYIVSFEADGRAEYYNLTANTTGTIAGAGTFSGAGVRVRQWKDDRAIISDPSKGYSTWDGTNLISVGCISTIGITNAGAGYTTVPTVTISAPNQTNGVQATAVASISNAAGTIVNAQITNIGSGYTSLPTVTIAAPSSQFGVQATASPTIQGGNVVAISITNPGLGYTSAPSITITGGGGSNAAATAVLGSGLVSSITITEPGTGYTSAPTVTISGGGATTNATAVAGYLTFATGTVGVVLTNGGTGYTSAPTVNITAAPGGGTNAAAKAIVNGGTVTQIVVTNAGAGYTSKPSISFSGGGGGTGAAANGVLTSDASIDIASFQGRVWIAQGRTVFYSAAGSYNDFVTVSAGNLNLTDDTLHTNITALISANNFLYVFGEDSINVFSDVRVGTTGLTQFTNTNVSASVGSKRINAIFPYFRSLLFMNDYGVYALVGATTTKLSDSLDGIFPLIDFTQPVSGGQVLLNNILCAAFNFYYNDPVQGQRPLQAVFFDKKWFLTSQGAVEYVTSVPTAGGVFLYSTSGSDLYKMYGNSTSNIASTVQTALWPLTDVIRDKQALKFGVEATLSNGLLLNITVDSQSNVSPTYSLTNTVYWYNNSGTTISWINNSSVVETWYGGSGYQLYKSDAQQYGKYLGLTLTSNSAAFVYNTFEMEYELRARF